jgi:hypothetical protein
VLSEYLQNQLTFKNGVFNFRVFFLLSLVKNIYRGYLINYIVIHRASSDKKKLNQNQNDSEELDTTSMISASTGQDYELKDLMDEIGKEKCKYIKQQIKHNLSYLLRIIKSQKIMKNFDTQENSYELFGLDFIADTDYNIKLIEFNHKTGLGDYPDELYNILVAGYIHSTINKLYESKYHIPIDKKIKKKIVRIKSNKNYLLNFQK